MEVDRLRAEQVRALGIVRAVVDATVVRSDPHSYALTSALAFPGRETAGRLQERARQALVKALAAVEAAENSDTGELTP